jgi:hypothetical protein
VEDQDKIILIKQEDLMLVGQSIRASVRGNLFVKIREGEGREFSRSWWDCVVVLQSIEGRFVICFLSEEFEGEVPELKRALFRLRAERETTRPLSFGRNTIRDFSKVVDQRFREMLRISQIRSHEDFIRVELEPLKWDELVVAGAVYAKNGQGVFL